MRITIEVTDEIYELPDGTRCQVWKGHTRGGVRVATAMVTLGCHPEDEAAFQRELLAEGFELDGGLCDAGLVKDPPMEEIALTGILAAA